MSSILFFFYAIFYHLSYSSFFRMLPSLFILCYPVLSFSYFSFFFLSSLIFILCFYVSSSLLSIPLLLSFVFSSFITFPHSILHFFLFLVHFFIPYVFYTSCLPFSSFYHTFSYLHFVSFSLSYCFFLFALFSPPSSLPIFLFFLVFSHHLFTSLFHLISYCFFLFVLFSHPSPLPIFLFFLFNHLHPFTSLFFHLISVFAKMSVVSFLFL